MNVQSNICLKTKELGESGEFTNELPASLNFSSENYEVGLKEIYLSRTWEDVKGLDCLFVHIDIVKHHLLGNKFTQLIQLLPITSKTESVFHYFNKPIYFPLYSSTFDNIKVSFRNEDGDSIKFKANSKAFLVLEIRKIKNDQFL